MVVFLNGIKEIIERYQIFGSMSGFRKSKLEATLSRFNGNQNDGSQLWLLEVKAAESSRELVSALEDESTNNDFK